MTSAKLLVRMDRALHASLKKQASAASRSVNDLVCDLLTRKNPLPMIPDQLKKGIQAQNLLPVRV